MREGALLWNLGPSVTESSGRLRAHKAQWARTVRTGELYAHAKMRSRTLFGASLMVVCWDIELREHLAQCAEGGVRQGVHRSPLSTDKLRTR